MAQQLASDPDRTRKVRRHSRTQQTMQTVGEATHFLLYLSLDTFVGAVSEELPAHVRAAMSCGMPIILGGAREREARLRIQSVLPHYSRGYSGPLQGHVSRRVNGCGTPGSEHGALGEEARGKGAERQAG
eukprot:787953-Prymnesium_polylepis.1